MKSEPFAVLSDLFAKSSASFKAANPHLGLAQTDLNAVAGNVARKKANLEGGKMNATEAAFALILESQKRKGEILSYHFQGMTLRWHVGNEIVKYTADFVVFAEDRSGLDANGTGVTFIKTKLIEVKGGYRKFPGYLERAIERFRHAKTRWPQFSFEMHKKTKDGWKQIL